MERKKYRWCAVPQCTNTSKTTPNKIFIDVPRKADIRKKWLNIARRKCDGMSVTSPIYFCGDHFDLPNDMENYMRYHVMGTVGKVMLKHGSLPTKFQCQSDRKRSLPSTVTSRPNAIKRQRLALVQEALEDRTLESDTKEANTTLSPSSPVEVIVEHQPKNQDEQRTEMVLAKEPEAAPGARCDHRVKEEPLEAMPADVEFAVQEHTNEEESSTEEAVYVKEEPSWENSADWCGVSEAATLAGLYGVSEAATLAGLYAGHAVKDELVVGPECLQLRDVVYTLRAASAQSVSDSSQPGPTSNRQLLRDCCVRLERISVPETLSCRESCTEQSGGSSAVASTDLLPSARVVKDCHVSLQRCDSLEQVSRLINIFECDTCGRKFRTKSSLSQHIRVHLPLHLRVNYKPNKPRLASSNGIHCQLCGKDFPDKSDLLSHEQIHYNGFACSVCGKQFKHTSHLRTHLRIHSGFKPYSCEICSKTFTQSSHLSIHKVIHSDTDGKDYSCQVCKKEFKRLDCLKLHERVHTGEKRWRYSCDICQKKCQTVSNLKSHQLVHTGVKSFYCDVCNKAFAYAQSLKGHKLTHANIKCYSCETCREKFRTFSDLKSHKHVHASGKLYSCKICKKQFNSSKSLYSHKIVHSDRIFCCGICQKEFKRQYSLNTHYSAHLGVKYSCDLCGKEFKRKDQLRGHIQTHTGVKRFSCQVCQMKFAQLKYFKAHLIIHSGSITI